MVHSGHWTPAWAAESRVAVTLIKKVTNMLLSSAGSHHGHCLFGLGTYMPGLRTCSGLPSKRGLQLGLLTFESLSVFGLADRGVCLAALRSWSPRVLAQNEVDRSLKQS